MKFAENTHGISNVISQSSKDFSSEVLVSDKTGITARANENCYCHKYHHEYCHDFFYENCHDYHHEFCQDSCHKFCFEASHESEIASIDHFDRRNDFSV